MVSGTEQGQNCVDESCSVARNVVFAFNCAGRIYRICGRKVVVQSEIGVSA